jgi:hypothetical protein
MFYFGSKKCMLSFSENIFNPTLAARHARLLEE